MAERFQAPRGTFDVLPAESAARDRVYAFAADLFERGVGASTDVVRKEMFTFEDQGGRSITLRPEATAAICRAYVEKGMQTLPQPVKLWWYGPLFRHERPQAGGVLPFS